MLHDMIWVFLVLLFVNYLCDYPLQNFFLAEWKQKENVALLIHCFIWSMGVSGALQHFGMFTWWKLIMLFIGHIIIDGWKCRGYYKRLKLSDRQAYYIDHVLHIIQIAICMI